MIDAVKIADIKAQVDAIVASEQAKIDTHTGDEAGINDKFVKTCLYNNERGDGLLFAKLHRNKFLYVKRTASWLVWNGIHWEADTRNLATAAVEEVAMAYNQRKIVLDASIQSARDNGNAPYELDMAERKAIVRRIDRLRSCKGAINCLDWSHKIGIDSLAIVGNETDKHPWLLPCLNGIVDLRTGYLHKGRPGDYLLTSASVPFPDNITHYLNTGENIPCPTWDKFMLEIHNDDIELLNFVQKWIGYNLTGLIIEHYIGVFAGAGRNGKGTMFETIKAILGKLAWSIMPDMLLEQKNPRTSAGPSADLMSLYGKRFVIASETDEGRRISAARVKWLTGGDSINARSPHDKFEINFIPSHKLNLYTNHIPKGLTKDFALAQRLLFIEYPMRYVDDVDAEIKKDPKNASIYRPKDKELMNKLKLEYSGILAWAVRGCLLWQRDGLNPPKSILASVDQLQRDEDHFAQFFEDCCEPQDVTWHIQRKALYETFEKWFHENKDECQPSKWGCSRQKMGEWLDKNGYKQETRGGQNIVFGVKIKSDVSFS